MALRRSRVRISLGPQIKRSAGIISNLQAADIFNRVRSSKSSASELGEQGGSPTWCPQNTGFFKSWTELACSSIWFELRSLVKR